MTFRMILRNFILLTVIFFGCKATQQSSENVDANQGGQEISATETNAINALLSNQDSTHNELVTTNFFDPIKDYRASNSKQFDLLHTKLELSFDWKLESVIGKAYLKLIPYFYPQDVLILDAKSLEIDYILLVENGERKELPYEFVGEQLFISLDHFFTRNEEINLEISYKATPGKRKVTGSDAITSDKGLFFINADGKDPYKPKQIWTQGETTSNSAWFPTIDSPNERTTQEMYITVPDSMTTISNGLKISSVTNSDGTKTDYWRMDKPHAPYLFMMAIGQFEKIVDRRGKIPLGYYVEPAYGKYAKNIFKNTPEMIDFFSDKLNFPYPWPQYNQVVVRDYVSGAMENTTASIFMEELQMTDKELLDTNWDYIIAHELFHHWFGDLVTCESWSNLPLNESFADFSEWLWIDYKYGKDEGDYHAMLSLENYFDEAQSTKKELVRFYYENKEDLFDRHSYEKGGAVLRMLKTYLGDEAFFAGLSYYLKENAFESVEIHDLRLAFEKITGEDLNWFFNQWFLQAGHPILSVDEKFESDTLSLVFTQKQDLDSFPLFKIPFYIDVYSKGKSDRIPIIINSATEEFKIPLTNNPDLVLIDTEQELVGKIIHGKTKEKLLYQLENVPNLIARHKAFELLTEENDVELMSNALKIALKDSSYRIISLALDFLQSAPDYLIVDQTREKVVSLLKHKEPEVRAGALYALIEYEPSKYRKEIESGVKDPAYSVQGVALEGVLLLENIEKKPIFEKFLKETQIDVLLPTANYINTLDDSSYFQWYEERVLKARGSNLFYILQYFAEFIVGRETVTQEKSVPMLKKIAIENPDYFTRYTAFQILFILNDSLDVDAVLQEIREKEEDEELSAIYEKL